MNPEVYNKDPSVKDPILITTIPVDITQASKFSGTLNPNSQFNLLWITYPDNPQLSLYNTHWTIRLGTDAPTYEYPYGSNIIAISNQFKITAQSDLLGTDYFRNRLMTVIMIENYTVNPVNFWCYFKTLTFATSIGASV